MMSQSMWDMDIGHENWKDLSTAVYHCPISSAISFQISGIVALGPAHATQ